MEENIQEFTITYENRGAIGFADDTKDLVIPGFFVGDGNNETVKGQTYRVTEIWGMTFYDCPNLETVRFPETLELIHNRAFEHCPSLKNVDTSKAKGLRTMSVFSFADCIQLKTFEIPENVTYVSRLAFTGSPLVQITSKSSAYKVIQNGTMLVSIKDNSVIWVSLEASEIVFPYGIKKLDLDPLSRQKYVFIPKTVTDISLNAFTEMAEQPIIIIDKPKDSILNTIFGENISVYWIG